jgi:hypothetical protein
VNAYCTIDELAGELGVAVTAANTAKLTACCEAAAIEIDHAIDSPDPPDYTGPPWDQLVNRVNILRGVEWWKSSAAAFGVIGYDQTGAIRTPRNGFARSALALLPVKQQFGVG